MRFTFLAHVAVRFGLVEKRGPLKEIRIFHFPSILGALDYEGFGDFRILAHGAFGRFFGDFAKKLSFSRPAVSTRLQKLRFPPQMEEPKAENRTHPLLRRNAIFKHDHISFQRGKS